MIYTRVDPARRIEGERLGEKTRKKKDWITQAQTRENTYTHANTYVKMHKYIHKYMRVHSIGSVNGPCAVFLLQLQHVIYR